MRYLFFSSRTVSPYQIQVKNVNHTSPSLSFCKVNGYKRRKERNTWGARVFVTVIAFFVHFLGGARGAYHLAPPLLKKLVMAGTWTDLENLPLLATETADCCILRATHPVVQPSIALCAGSTHPLPSLSPSA